VSASSQRDDETTQNADWLPRSAKGNPCPCRLKFWIQLRVRFFSIHSPLITLFVAPAIVGFIPSPCPYVYYSRDSSQKCVIFVPTPPRVFNERHLLSSGRPQHGHAFQRRSRSSREQSCQVNSPINSSSDPPGGLASVRQSHVVSTHSIQLISHQHTPRCPDSAPGAPCHRENSSGR